MTSYTEGFSHFVTSMTAPVASGWSVRRVGLAPTGKRRLLTAHANSGHSGTAWRMVKSALRSPIEVQNGRVERNAGLLVPSRSRSTGPHRVCKTGGPGATPRGQGLTDLVHVDEDDWRGEEREHLGHQQSADNRIA